MLAFHDVLFPPKIAYGASGGPGFNTSIATTVSGFEQRNINWRTARGRWDVGTGIKNSHNIEEILAFFRARFGKAFGFRFRDWSDYRAINQVLGVGDNNKKSFEFYKDYKSGDYHYARRILKLVTSSVRIYVDSIAVTNYTLDATTGIVTFSIPPEKGSIIRSDFEFDVPVRFDTDQIIVRASGPNHFISDSILIVEISQ